jgi:hypothetical protein
MDPETLEVAPSAEREALEGWIPELASEEEVREALEKAFNYRGDVTITTRSGAVIEGYVFDRRAGATLAASAVRIYPKDSTDKLTIPYADIARLAFTGRDTAAGMNWEAWLRNYWTRKMAGEKNIALEPEALD